MKDFMCHRGGLIVSEVTLGILALMMLALDIGAYWLTEWLLRLTRGLEGPTEGILFLITAYVCSLFAWIGVIALWRLLRTIGRGEVFSEKTVQCLRITALCCFLICLVLLLSGLYFLPMLLLVPLACFVGAIVSIMASAFHRALQMQDELDFTV